MKKFNSKAVASLSDANFLNALLFFLLWTFCWTTTTLFTDMGELTSICLRFSPFVFGPVFGDGARCLRAARRSMMDFSLVMNRRSLRAMEASMLNNAFWLSFVTKVGLYTCFPMASAPANFFVIRIASQHSRLARNTRRVVPCRTFQAFGRSPIWKAVIMVDVYASSSLLHFPFLALPLESFESGDTSPIKAYSLRPRSSESLKYSVVLASESDGDVLLLLDIGKWSGRRCDGRGFST